MGWDIAHKIHQMIAKAESTTSLAEAEAIMVKVRQMLDKHGVSLLDLPDPASDDPVETEYSVDHFWQADGWCKRLSNVAANYYGVRIVWTKRGNKTLISITGRESCRAAFKYMFPYLRRQIMKLADRGWRHRQYSSQSVGRTQVAHALADRLNGMMWERQQAAAIDPKLAASSTALVPVDELDQQMLEDWGDIKKHSPKKQKPVSLTAVLDANSISLDDQLTKDAAAETKTLT